MTENKINELENKRQRFVVELKRAKPPKGEMYSCGMHRQGVKLLEEEIKSLDNQINHLKSHAK